MANDQIQGGWTSDPRPVLRANRRDRVVQFAQLASLVTAYSALAVLMSVFLPVSWEFLSYAPIFAVLALITNQHKWFPIMPLARSSELSLHEDPDDPDVAVVVVEVRSGKKLVGADRGVLWVSEGMIHFRGLASYFGLGLGDVFAFSSGRSLVVRLLNVEADRTVRISALRTSKHWRAEIDRTRFARMSTRIQRESREGARAGDRRVLPPELPWKAEM